MHVGAYGAAPRARRRSMRWRATARAFDRAWTTAPITLTAHASLLTGRYPPGHGARHNGMAVARPCRRWPTALKAAGFATAAFVSAFPLDRRFGLARGFDVYDDELPRGGRRPSAERARRRRHRDAGDRVARRASRTAASFCGSTCSSRTRRTAIAGDRGSRARALRRATSAIADREVGPAARARSETPRRPRWWSPPPITARRSASTARSATASSSTTRRCACRCSLRGPGVPAGGVVNGDVSLVDLAADHRGADRHAADRSRTADRLTPAFGGDADRRRVRSTPSRSRRCSTSDGRACARCATARGSTSPRRSPSCTTPAPIRTSRPTVSTAEPRSRGGRRAPGRQAGVRPSLSRARQPGSSTASPKRRRACARWAMRAAARRVRRPARARPDPKDRIAIASQMAQVTSGEVTGDELGADPASRSCAADPQNPQAHLRLGYAEIDRGRCDRAEPHLRVALAGRRAVGGRRPWAGRLPGCGVAIVPAPRAALGEARRAEPGNPVVAANLGLLALQNGDFAMAIDRVAARPCAPIRCCCEARFALARAMASRGDRAGRAAAEADEAARAAAAGRAAAPRSRAADRRSPVTNRAPCRVTNHRGRAVFKCNFATK